MSQRTDQVIDRWIDIETGHGTNTRNIRSLNCFFEGPILYSYGHHFQLARALKDRNGTTTGFLLNGDTFSVTTSRQQSSVRSSTQGSGLPTVIIPFSALNASGLDMASVRMLDVTQDTWDVTTHESDVELPNWRWRRDPVRSYVDLTDEEIQVKVDARNAKAREELESKRERYRRAVVENDTFWINHYKDVEAEEPRTYTREDLNYGALREYRTVGHVDRLYANGFSNATINVHDEADGRRWYSWETSRHWLGESLIEADVTWSRTVRCRACRGTGQTSPSVAVMVGLIATPDRLMTRNWDRDHFFPGDASNNHRMTRCSACDGNRGRWVTGRRRARFLSGFDHNESRRSYFFAELPPVSRATTVAEAYEDLKPDAVKLAEGMGRDVKRQGDIFAVELRTLDKRGLRKAGATFERRGNLLGTNHVATEVARMPDGTTLARGTLTHAPEFRRPDHARVRLGNTWHAIVKNTVPVAA